LNRRQVVTNACPTVQNRRNLGFLETRWNPDREPMQLNFAKK
jgi:hypothetical protein